MNQPPSYVFHSRGDLPPQVEKSHVSKREERESSEKHGERAAQSTNKWTYSAVLSFLDPCSTPRETSGNMGRRAVEVRTAESREEERAEAAAGPSHRAVDK
ncbi:hypothetical protein EYF80_023267 [Liparis tanakae]|uniref:Uncharacterized protein n=1 Tax=Liparis tanakae TaxID=230148 RepID=A0A4Z2HNE7_9TELE|nr:hypothetical protein EYF80_023267 [Liparis tanakae]